MTCLIKKENHGNYINGTFHSYNHETFGCSKMLIESNKKILVGSEDDSYCAEGGARASS